MTKPRKWRVYKYVRWTVKYIEPGTRKRELPRKRCMDHVWDGGKVVRQDKSGRQYMNEGSVASRLFWKK